MLLSQFYTPIHEIPWVLAEYSRLKAHFAEMEDSSAGMAGLDGKLWKGLKKARVLVETARTNGDCNTSVISELDATLAYLQGENLRVMAETLRIRKRWMAMSYIVKRAESELRAAMVGDESSALRTLVEKQAPRLLFEVPP
ncbi:hypothetical protein CC2G_015145 [Coprinopsis cinerea AmutBmut pab1-1]|nr:hypothetical protein CC2G_015145 [Coprinopsis cinerea AmutBmut pab1-1]